MYCLKCKEELLIEGYFEDIKSYKRNNKWISKKFSRIRYHCPWCETSFVIGFASEGKKHIPMDEYYFCGEEGSIYSTLKEYYLAEVMGYDHNYDDEEIPNIMLSGFHLI